MSSLHSTTSIVSVRLANNLESKVYYGDKKQNGHICKHTLSKQNISRDERCEPHTQLSHDAS